MPQLNPEHCYTRIVLKKKLANDALVLSDFASIVALYTTVGIDFIKNGLASHVGLDATYTHKILLIDVLQSVNDYLNNKTVADDTKQMIVDKLLEGILFCTPGFHIRVNSIVLGLTRPCTIDDYLQQLRVAIVDATARRFSDDVHIHNAFFIHAALKGYGVNISYQDDGFSYVLSQSDSLALDKAFKDRYNAMAILSELPMMIDSEFRQYYGYQGRYLEGYSYGLYAPIQKFFEKMFEREIAFDLLFESNDDKTAIEDINWHFVQKLLRQWLQDKKYLIFNASEAIFFDAIDNEDDTIAFNLLKERNYQRLIIDCNFKDYLSLLRYTSDRIKAFIIPFFFDKPVREYSITAMHQYLILLNELNINDPIIKKAQAAKILTKWFTAEKKLRLKEMLIQHHKHTYKLNNRVLSFLSCLLDNQLQTMVPELEKTIMAMLTLPHPLSNSDNILMIAINFQPNLISTVFAVIRALPTSEKRRNFLLAKNKAGYNALMLAIIDQQSAVQLLLDIIATLSKEEQFDLLMDKKDSDRDSGYNALMLAIKYNRPAAVQSLIAVIQALPTSEKRREFLLAKNKAGYNALMLAIIDQQSAVQPLLDTIATLSKEEQFDLLMDKNDSDRDSGYNALMLAIKYNRPAAAVQSLIAVIQALPTSEKRREFLLAKNKAGYNALMLAITDQQSAVKPLLDTIATLPEEEQFDLLMDKNDSDRDSGYNALMLAITYNRPAAVQSLIAVIQALPTSEKWRNFLLAKNKAGYNALMLAIIDQQSAVKPLLDIIVTLSQKDQFDLLIAKTKSNYNALMLAAKQVEPIIIERLITIIATFPDSFQNNIITAENNDEGHNALMIALRYRGMYKADDNVASSILAIALLYNYNTNSMLECMNSYFKMRQQCHLVRDRPNLRQPIRFKQEMNRLVTIAITKIDSEKPLEKEIKANLKRMGFNAQSKQIAVLNALATLKKTTPKTVETETAIKDAINDNNSPLYKALNTHRYGFFALNGETASIKRLKGLTNLSLETNKSCNLTA